MCLDVQRKRFDFLGNSIEKRDALGLFEQRQAPAK